MVLLLALLGVWSLAPDRAWGGIPELRVYAPPDPSLTFLAQLLPPVGIVVAIYMCWVGAKNPAALSRRHDFGGDVAPRHDRGPESVPWISHPWLRLPFVVGPVIFLAIGLAAVGRTPFLLTHRVTPNR